MTIHSTIMLPGSTYEFVCVDGLSPLDVLNIEHIFHFGGDMRFVNCGADNEYVAMYQARDDM